MVITVTAAETRTTCRPSTRHCRSLIFFSPNLFTLIADGVISSGIDSNTLLVGTQAALATGHARNVSSGLPDASDGVLLVNMRRKPRVSGAWVLPTRYLHDMIRLGGADIGSASMLAVDTADATVVHLQPERVSLAPLPRRTIGAPGNDQTQPRGSLLRMHSQAMAVSPSSSPSSSSRLPLPSALPSALRLRVLRRYASLGASALAAQRRAAHANAVVHAFGYAWVVHTHLGRRPSSLQLVDMASGELHPTTVPLAGRNCHSPVFHRGSLLYLNSSVGGLARLSSDGRHESLWQGGPHRFSKGLAVIDDVAYFGVSDKTGAVGRNWARSEIVAVDLAGSTTSTTTTTTASSSGGKSRVRLLWSVPLPPPHGLVNSLAAPAVAAHGCSWRACSTARRHASAAPGRHEHSARLDEAIPEDNDDDAVHLPRRDRWAALLGLAPQEG